MTRRDDIRILLRELRAAFAWRHLRRFLLRRRGLLIPLALACAGWFGYSQWSLSRLQPAPPPPPISLLDPSTFEPDAPGVDPLRVLDPEGRYLVYRETIRTTSSNSYRTALYDRKEHRALIRFYGEPATPSQGEGHLRHPSLMWLVGDRLFVATGGNDNGWDGETNDDQLLRISTLDIRNGSVESECVVEGMFDMEDVDPTGRYAVGLGPDPLWKFSEKRDRYLRPVVVDLRTGESWREPLMAKHAYFLDEETIGVATRSAIQGWRWREDQAAPPFQSLGEDAGWLWYEGEVDPRSRTFHIKTIYGEPPVPVQNRYSTLVLAELEADGEWTESVYRAPFESNQAQEERRTETNYRGIVVRTWSNPDLDRLCVEPASGLALRNLGEQAAAHRSVPVTIVDLARGIERVVAWREYDPSLPQQRLNPWVKFLGPRTIGIRDRTPSGDRWTIHPVEDFLYEGPPWRDE